MHDTKRTVGMGAALGAALTLLAASGAAPARGDEGGAGHPHNKAQQHGGTVVMTEAHHFEVVFDKNMVKVFGYDIDQNPISLRGVSGSATLRTRGGGGGGRVKLEYHSADAGDYLEAHLEGLSGQEAGKAKVTFELSGLSPGGTTTFVAKYSPPGKKAEGQGQHGH